MKLLITLSSIIMAWSVANQVVLAEEVGEFECPTGPNYVIGDYPAYEVEFAASERQMINLIAEQVVRKIDELETVSVAGHAADFGNEDFRTTSEQRAEFVLDEIISKAEELLGREVEILIEYYGYAIDCPIGDNNTREGRAQNRRAEVWLVEKSSSGADIPSQESLPNFRQMMKAVGEQTESSLVRCLAGKLRKKKFDHRYLNPAAIDELLELEASIKPGKVIESAVRNMREQLIKAYQRVKSTVSDQTAEARLERSISRHYRLLKRGINKLGAQANCADNSVVVMRRFLSKRSKESESVYSCKLAKQKVEAMMASIGGKAKGCGAN